ncbi:MAG: dTDP-4-dehydrorhamnose 3,5-epimerase [Candidatus Delongbacteria bacterium]|jgi:dTDP-4-dehydrorhamnose 3,5-epimerase|nr:dTDP-4-dehydrorhamnose 3,5-epimerase [Candidatus Delongbacteria bacterium]
MEIIKTDIPDLLILKPRIFGDRRGYFFESWRDEWLENIGISTKFVQDNESSSRCGVIRGLHYQLPPHPQAKLVRVIRGKVLDVAVDIRKNSPTYGKHVAVELTEDNHWQFFIPHGFAHGFAVLSEQAVFTYKCDDYYHPECESGIAWNDPDLNIDWKIKPEDSIVSDKDKHNPAFNTVRGISL